MALDLGLLIAGAKERGELESRVTNLIAEIRAAGNVVLMSVPLPPPLHFCCPPHAAFTSLSAYWSIICKHMFKRVVRSFLNDEVFLAEATLKSVMTNSAAPFEMAINIHEQMTESMLSGVCRIDEVHMLVGAGSVSRAGGSGLDISNLLKPPLARGELQCIGATTLDDHRKYIERDAALERRFQPVHVAEPTTTQALQILHGLQVTNAPESCFVIGTGQHAIRNCQFFSGMKHLGMAVRHSADTRACNMQAN